MFNPTSIRRGTPLLFSSVVINRLKCNGVDIRKIRA